MMTSLEIWLLAISVAMDCFSVSITSGIILRRVMWKTFLTIAFFFGLFQAVMPIIGWFAASRFHHLIENFDHWIFFNGLGESGYLCVEPQSGKVNGLNIDGGHTRLAAGEKIKFETRITK